jgi:Mg2+ and Co2+ transporter CorA
MTTEAERHLRDIYDHLIRIGDLIGTYRDLLSSSMDVSSPRSPTDSTS